MRVIYIAGAGRSGSTLLEGLLGNMGGVVSVGEIRFFWEYASAGNRRCSCGSLLSDCVLWRAVLQHLRDQDVDVDRAAAAARRLDRTRQAVRHRFCGCQPSEYGFLRQATAALYRAVSDHIGGRTIVDSSKVPSHLGLLRDLAGLDLRVLHLVRDGRAVAYSWSKRPKEDPGVQGERRQMRRRAALVAMLVWMVENGLLERLTTGLPFVARVRYEDFARCPREQLAIALRRLEVPADEQIWLNEFGLQPTHGVGGNPLRFSGPSKAIRLDDAWRTRLHPTMKLLLAALGGRSLRRYGY
jgi:Sulfotransferase family